MRPSVLSRRARVAVVALLIAAAAWTGATARGDTAHPDWDEWDFLRLANRERWERGIAPLAMNPALRELARSWSDVMATENSLHHDPNLRAGIADALPGWQRLAENVGFGSSVLRLHDSFMSSPGHRANLLEPAYNAAGVGVTWSAGTLWVTVKFAKATNAATALRTPVTQVGGGADLDTGVALSGRRAAGSAAAVVVARDDDFADALAGVPLAAVGSGPMLLVRPAFAPPSVVSEARRVLRQDGIVQLLGGMNALSAEVEAAFVSEGLAIERIAGHDRYSTAALVAAHVNQAPETVFLVSGSGYADALTAGAPAAALRAPIILLDPRSPMSPGAAYMAVSSAQARVVVGGPNAVPESVAAAARATERVFGADRFATSSAMVRRFLPSVTRVVIASGLRYQDALLGGPEAGRLKAALVVTAPGTPRPTYDVVAAVNPKWGEALVIGSRAAVPANDVTLMFS